MAIRRIRSTMVEQGGRGSEAGDSLAESVNQRVWIKEYGVRDSLAEYGQSR